MENIKFTFNYILFTLIIETSRFVVESNYQLICSCRNFHSNKTVNNHQHFIAIPLLPNLKFFMLLQINHQLHFDESAIW